MVVRGMGGPAELRSVGGKGASPFPGLGREGALLRGRARARREPLVARGEPRERVLERVRRSVDEEHGDELTKLFGRERHELVILTVIHTSPSAYSGRA